MTTLLTTLSLGSTANNFNPESSIADHLVYANSSAISLNDSRVRILAGKLTAESAISMSDFTGKKCWASYQFTTVGTNSFSVPAYNDVTFPYKHMMFSVVGGGGAGGYITGVWNGSRPSGGGSGGDVVVGTLPIPYSTTISYTVGAGGSGFVGQVGTGGSSTVTINGITYTATGGTQAPAVTSPSSTCNGAAIGTNTGGLGSIIGPEYYGGGGAGRGTSGSFAIGGAGRSSIDYSLNVQAYDATGIITPLRRYVVITAGYGGGGGGGNAYLSSSIINNQGLNGGGSGGNLPVTVMPGVSIGNSGTAGTGGGGGGSVRNTTSGFSYANCQGGAGGSGAVRLLFWF